MILIVAIVALNGGLGALSLNVESALTRWDAAHYISISRNGYAQNSASCAFYPLWPFVIRVFTYSLGGDYVLAGVVASFTCSTAAFICIYYYCAMQFGACIAMGTLCAMLAFPSAHFLNLLYTEPLFLLLVSLQFIGMSRRNVLLIALTGLLLPLTRAIGVFTMLPLVYYLHRTSWSWRKWLLCLPPLIGYLAYFLLLLLLTGDAFSGFEAQAYYPTKPSIAKILDLKGFGRAFISVGPWHDMKFSASDRIAFLLFLFSLPAIWRLGRLYFVYAISVSLIPALSNHLLSYTRFVLICFPLFVVIGKLYECQRLRPLFIIVCAIGALEQAILLHRYLNGLWAG